MIGLEKVLYHNTRELFFQYSRDQLSAYHCTTALITKYITQGRDIRSNLPSVIKT